MTRPASTSFHRVNGDFKSGRIWRPLYHLANRLNNAFPEVRVDGRLVRRRLFLEPGEIPWSELDGAASPSRLLSDLVWRSVPWQALLQELETIQVLDIGCGSGRYLEKLQQFSGGRLAGYTGLDLHASPKWPEMQAAFPQARFVALPAERALEAVRDEHNLIISQSALEHIEGDLQFFAAVAEHVARRNRPLVQAHLVPAAAARRLYDCHGFRQYTPRTLSKITRLFSPFSYAVLLEMGGPAGNALHHRWVTEPMLAGETDGRQARPAEYAAALRQAVVADMNDARRAPSFYALLLHSHPRQRLFADGWKAARRFE